MTEERSPNGERFQMTEEEMFHAADVLRQPVISDDALNKALQAYNYVFAFFDGRPDGGLVRKALTPEYQILHQMKMARKGG